MRKVNGDPDGGLLRSQLRALGARTRAVRGGVGIRIAADLIGVSAATLSRVERGHMSDLATFVKVCRWLDVDPGDVIWTRTEPS